MEYMFKAVQKPLFIVMTRPPDNAAGHTTITTLLDQSDQRQWQTEMVVLINIVVFSFKCTQ
jgi:hypothetical protein